MLQQIMDNILKERRLRWLGHVIRIDHQCIPRQALHWHVLYQDTRKDHVDQDRTGGAQSTKTYKRWGSPGKKQRWQLLTDTDDIRVCPNVSSWMRDELRFKILIK